MLEKTKKLVEYLLKEEDSGHGMDHITRVFNMSMIFAEKEGANKEIVGLIVLLHDVDDYKLFGMKNQKELTNARAILTNLNLDENTINKVLQEVAKIGYSKRLKGIEPETVEGKIVSDADMCDALGANGILRTYQYSLKQGRTFFDKNIWPINNISAETYTNKTADTAVCHFFEKILKLKKLMLTNAGKAEAEKRHNFVVEFLKQYFNEENASDWLNYLEEFLKKEEINKETLI